MKRLLPFLVGLLAAVLVASPTQQQTATNVKYATTVTPAFVADVGQNGVYNNASTLDTTVTAAVATGTRIVVVYSSWDSTTTVSSVSDTQGNTYAIDVNQATGGNMTLLVASAPVTTALTTSDVVTVNLSGSTCERRMTVFVLSNTTSFDVGATYSAFIASGSPDNATNTTSAATSIIGLAALKFYGSPTYTPGSGWTSNGANGGAGAIVAIRRDSASGGTIDTAGSWNQTQTANAIWAAYK